MRAARIACAFAAALAFAACQTTPPAQWTPLAADDAGAAARLAALRVYTQARTSLRANARVSLSGAAGESFSKQLVLAERDAKLRIEVVGLLNQRVLVLASDGVEYDLYRAETGKIESGAVDASVLWRIARIPLLPSEAVGLLLAAPALPPEPPRAAVGADGALRLDWPDRGVTLDATGRLAEARVRDGPGGEELARATFLDWRGDGDGAFPSRVQLDFATERGAATIEFQNPEPNASLDPSWFRLRAAAQSGGSPGARP